MLQTVDVGERSLDAYERVSLDTLLHQLRAGAADLRGVRILNINATPYGGRVSELLRSSVPLLNDLGLLADWKIVSGDTAPFSKSRRKSTTDCRALKPLSPTTIRTSRRPEEYGGLVARSLRAPVRRWPPDTAMG